MTYQYSRTVVSNAYTKLKGKKKSNIVDEKEKIKTRLSIASQRAKNPNYPPRFRKFT